MHLFETLVGRSGKRTAECLVRRILVVDDDWFLREFNAATLIRTGYVVDVAADGAAAWEAIQRHDYDLLITDNDMPKLTGIELIKELRLAGMTLPVILASGSLEALAKNSWLDSVATLQKPHSADQLLALVKSMLQSKTEEPGSEPGWLEGAFLAPVFRSNHAGIGERLGGFAS